jgi:hypothetical protein
MTRTRMRTIAAASAPSTARTSTRVPSTPADGDEDIGPACDAWPAPARKHQGDVGVGGKRPHRPLSRRGERLAAGYPDVREHSVGLRGRVAAQLKPSPFGITTSRRPR